MSLRRQKQILIAGGAGFLGSHLCDRLLSDGAEVTCIDNFLTGQLEYLTFARREPRFELIEADVVSPLPTKLTRRRFDQIYNLACAASPPIYQAQPEHTLLTSVIGTLHLARLAESCGARLLLTSTSEVYGDPEMHPQREDYWGHVNCTGPRACYDEGKRAAETLCFDLDRLSRLEIRVARIFNTYGPRLRAEDGRVVSTVIAQSLAGAPITIFGDGRQTRSFCYVDDLVDGLARLMAYDGRQPGPVNLGNPSEHTILELVEMVRKATGSSSAVVRRPLPEDDPKRRRPDISKAGALLGWRPATALGEGLRRTIEWFESRRLLVARAVAPDVGSTTRGDSPNRSAAA
ncbi:MAG: SDR family oxidoreductase [Caulobacteraceae bacterium]|nr:SDR family oxidoreductase [Caulobacteraceae bacterium]